MTSCGCQVFRFVPLTHPRSARQTLSRSLPLGVLPILDLEDSVGFGTAAGSPSKAEAREVLESLATRHTGAAVGVRVNDLNSGEAEADAALLMRCGASGFAPVVLVPKIRRASDLATWRELLPFAREVIPIVETPSALEHADEISRASKHVVMGFFDLVLEIGKWPPMPPNGEAFWSAAGPVLEAAARHGTIYVHPPFPELWNDDGFLAAADRLRARFGERFAMCVLTSRQQDLLLGRREPLRCGPLGLPSDPLERALFISRAYEYRQRSERTCLALDGYLVSPHEALLARRYLQGRTE